MLTIVWRAGSKVSRLVPASRRAWAPQDEAAAVRRDVLGPAACPFHEALSRAPASAGTHGSACQMSLAYSAMVRSLENGLDAAMLRMALRDQFSWSTYASPRRECASP